MNIIDIITELNGGVLAPKDGIKENNIVKIEEELNIRIPNTLREFYKYAGNSIKFAHSFEYFFKLNELELDESKLYFVEESISNCAWCVDLENNYVYQNDNGQLYDEEIDIDKFMILMTYYNAAQSDILDYRSQCIGDDYKMLINKIDSTFKEVVNHNGLCIYAFKDNLVWFFYENATILNSNIYLTFNNKELFNKYHTILSN